MHDVGPGGESLFRGHAEYSPGQGSLIVQEEKGQGEASNSRNPRVIEY